MNEWLAQYFGTASVSDETEKQASAELFIKLASENGIDLKAMSDAEVQELYESTMGKTAEDDRDDDKKKKVEEAAKEHEEKKESAAKFAEAELMGQIMAHSFEAERERIKEAAGEGAKLRRGFEQAKGHVAEFGARVSGSKVREAKGALSNLKNREHHIPGGAKLETSMGAHVKKLKSEALRARLKAGGGAAAALAAGEGTRRAVTGSEKKSSALDELAAEYAVTKVASAGWDADEAAQRIVSVLTLGVSDENSKVAFTQTLDEAVEVRSLELAEAAGYPVTWPTE